MTSVVKAAGKSSCGGTADALFGFTSFTERNLEQELPKSTNETNRVNIILFIVVEFKFLESKFHTKTK